MKIGKVSVTTFSWLECDKHLHWCFHDPFDKDKECVSKKKMYYCNTLNPEKKITLLFPGQWLLGFTMS